MKHFFLVAMIVYGVSLHAADQCLNCHKELRTPQAVAFERDVHYKAGLTCASCHGGDPSAEDMEIAMSPQKGFIGKLKPASIPGVCGSCHGEKNNFRQSNVFSAFEQSVHARALGEQADGPQCVSCHGVHDIVGVRDKSSPV